MNKKIIELAHGFAHHNIALGALTTNGYYTRNISQAHTREYSTIFLDKQLNFQELYSKNNPAVTRRAISAYSALSANERTAEKIGAIIEEAKKDHRKK